METWGQRGGCTIAVVSLGVWSAQGSAPSLAPLRQRRLAPLSLLTVPAPSVFLPGMTAIPCACLGIFLGGLLVKKLSLSALGAIRMAMLVNLVSTACYVSFLFLGCDTGPVAGVTVPYGNT